MEIEHWIDCPRCNEEISICTSVPDSAWEPNGAHWNFKDQCPLCDETIDLYGRVESEITT